MTYNGKRSITATSIGLGLLLVSSAIPSHVQAVTETEYRLGAMASIPFGVNVVNFFAWKKIRLGLVGQIASVRGTEIIFERDYNKTFDGVGPENPGQLTSQTLTGMHQLSTSKSNFAVGGQLELYFTPFADKIEYGELAGPIIGTREVQLAGLIGYNNLTGIFEDVGLMLPYSKIGFSIDAGIFSPYVAGTTLGAFGEKKIDLFQNVYNDNYTGRKNSVPPAPTPEPTPTPPPVEPPTVI